MENKRYNILYLDPPWTFNTYSKKGKEKKSPEIHYPCMKIEDIYNLPIQKLSADDCALFLWITNPMLPQGLECIKRWGFEYKTVAFSWFKKNKVSDSWFFGLGYWSRQNTEHVLLATKGNPKRADRGVSQVVESEHPYKFDFNFEQFDTIEIATKIREHSRKPDEVRDRIVKLCGDLPRLEMFARQKFPGWDVFGNEVEGSITLP